MFDVPTHALNQTLATSDSEWVMLRDPLVARGCDGSM